MKKLERTVLKFLAIKAEGPFSYKMWPAGRQMTVTKSSWVHDDLLIIEKTASEYLRHQIRNEAINRVKDQSDHIISMLQRLNENDVHSVEHTLKHISGILDDLYLSLDLRYARGHKANNDTHE